MHVIEKVQDALFNISATNNIQLSSLRSIIAAKNISSYYCFLCCSDSESSQLCYKH